MRPVVGIIGGSGFYRMPGFAAADRLVPDTPFGRPSGEVVIGELAGVPVAFVPRHGPGHGLPPSAVPYRANIFALKALGVHTVVAVNAVGSLDIAVAPGELALPDDVYDRTSGRESSFFGEGLVVHVGFAEPLCGGVRRALADARAEDDPPVRQGGTLVVMSGPRFSTRAESAAHRAAGFRLVGMTTMPEAVLAREAEMCYACLAVVTDYDVWHETAAPVTVDTVIATLRSTVGAAQRIVAAAVPALAARGDCTCRHALDDAITTDRGAVDPALAGRLAPILGSRAFGA